MLLPTMSYYYEHGSVQHWTMRVTLTDAHEHKNNWENNDIDVPIPDDEATENLLTQSRHVAPCL